MDAARSYRWGHRDAPAILLAYRHGLRASEVVGLRWDDVDFHGGKLHVRRAKDGATSVHPIGGKELRALRRLLRELRGMEIVRPNQVWTMDITYIPMARGFVYDSTALSERPLK